MPKVLKKIGHRSKIGIFRGAIFMQTIHDEDNS